jgi:hypothetical protein
MPSLNELLHHTMVFVAARNGAQPQAKQKSFPKPGVPQSISDEDAPNQAIWHWTAQGPDKFTDVTCISRGMGMGTMTVCTEIAFGAVTVTTPDNRKTVLKLEERYLVESYGLASGRITAGGGLVFGGTPVPFQNSRISAVAQQPIDLYPLEMNVDKSLLHVFAFEMPLGPVAGEPQQVKKEVLASAHFMPHPTSVSQSLEASRGALVEMLVDRFRVVVFVSLVCGKERADFDPGGLLGSGRLIPHVMVMANRPLKSVRSSITVTRPASMIMTGGDHSVHANMNGGIEASLFADNNDASTTAGNPDPYWDNLFRAYLSPASSGEYPVVRPDVEARTVKDAVKVINTELVGAPFYELASIRRLRRQGAFDNIHLSPTMKVTQAVSGVTKSTLDRVYMAPFCEHDCLHTHWRWGTFATPKSNQGWKSNGSTPDDPKLFPGAPYSEIGAPMVPENQQVTVKVKSLSSFEYSVRAGIPDDDEKQDKKGTSLIPAGTYTFINHHGSGYAVSVASPFTFYTVAVGGIRSQLQLSPFEEALPVPSGSNWMSEFYWHLRYALISNGPRSGDKEYERMLIADLAKVLTG